jgi:hypothetical protein
MSVSTDFGGMEVALLYELCGSELVSRACPSTLLNIGWYAPIAKSFISLVVRKFATLGSHLLLKVRYQDLWL